MPPLVQFISWPRRHRLWMVFCGVIFITPLISQIRYGQIGGTVTQETTAQPLAGANIILENTDLGAATDTRGRFQIQQVPVGSYTVRIEMMGFGTQYRANIHVEPGRTTTVNAALEQQVIAGEEIVVTGSFFKRARDAVVSAHTVDSEEIRSDPAGVYDIQRMMEALPAVVMAADQQNEIIVRGGDAGENLFIMDHMEIANPNHFGEPGAAGGAINILNSEFIERIDFYAGAFPARYGGRLSSVMDVTLREGDREQWQTHLELSMAGVGATLEGPIAGGRGSYLGSYRKSFLDLVIQDVGLTAVPHYSNWQGKVVYDISPANKLLLNWLGGNDRIDLEGSNMPQTQGIANLLADGGQNVLGLTLKSLLFGRGFSFITVGRTSRNIAFDLFNVSTDGEKIGVYDLDDVVADLIFKGDVIVRLTENLELNWGFDLKWRSLDRNSIVGADTVWTYSYSLADVISRQHVTEAQYYDLLLHAPDAIVHNDGVWLWTTPSVTVDSLYTTRESAFHGQLKWRPFQQLEIIGGLRAFRIEKLEQRKWAPRLGLMWMLSERLNVSLAFGQHYQAPSYFQLFTKVAAATDYMSSRQTVLGLEYLHADDIRGTVEVYQKSYHNLVVASEDLVTGDTVVVDGFYTAGSGHAAGVEFFLQKKFTNQWYGSASYSLFQSTGDDPRDGFEGQTYPRGSDYGQMFTLIGGYKLKYAQDPAYGQLISKWWWPWVAWLPFLPADEVQISFRLRGVGGRPFTQKAYNPTVRRWYQPTHMPINGERLRPYLRFDLMVLRRFNFDRLSLVTYIDIQNVFGRNNEWDKVYYLDGASEIALQYKQFPVGGFTMEF